MKKLSNLRLFFILYIVIIIIVEIVFGYGIYEESLQELPGPEFIKSPAIFVITTILSNAFLLLLGILFFYYLLKKKNWARITLMIIGIINIVDAGLSLLFNEKIIAFISQFLNIGDEGQILLLDKVTGILTLIFWGYAIYLFLADEEVKEIFITREE
ncbi:hypothetical protein ACFLS7_01180 [Bacteroidota bacterium]